MVQWVAHDIVAKGRFIGMNGTRLLTPYTCSCLQKVTMNVVHSGDSVRLLHTRQAGLLTFAADQSRSSELHTLSMHYMPVKSEWDSSQWTIEQVNLRSIRNILPSTHVLTKGLREKKGCIHWVQLCRIRHTQTGRFMAATEGSAEETTQSSPNLVDAAGPVNVYFTTLEQESTSSKVPHTDAIHLPLPLCLFSILCRFRSDLNARLF